MKRLKQTRKAKLQMNALTLFDAAVKNCGQQFHQAFTSRATMNALVEVIDDSHTENIVRNRIGSLLKQWMNDPEFKDKAQYAMLGATYKKLTTEKNYTFIDGPSHQSVSSASTTVAGAAARKTQDDLLAKREEEEFAKASKFIFCLEKYIFSNRIQLMRSCLINARSESIKTTANSYKFTLSIDATIFFNKSNIGVDNDKSSW